MVAATTSTNNENNANNTSVIRMLAQLNTVCFDKWAEQIKSLKAHTPQQILSRPTNVPPTMPTTHNVTVSLSRDNVSIKTQKYAHFQRFCHAVSAAFSQKATD